MLHPHYIEYLYFDLPVVRHGALLLPGVSQLCDWKRALLCFSSPTLHTRCQKKKKMKKIKKKKIPPDLRTATPAFPLPLPRSPSGSFLPQQPETPAGRHCVCVETHEGSSADSCWKTFSEFIAAVPPPPEAQCVFADFLPPWFPVLTVWWERAFFFFFL